jgi:HAD superfamily hydrolase (TIGR01450 family)
MKTADICWELVGAVRKDFWIFDIGGTLWKSLTGPEIYDDALALYRLLQTCGKTTALYSNICFMSAREITEAMNRTGFKITQDLVFTGSSVTAEYISSEKEGARCFAIGESAMHEDLVAQGVEVVVNPPADFVIVGLNRGLTLQEVSFAVRLVRDGARLLYIDERPICQTRYLGNEEITIGPRALVAAIEFSAGVRAATVCKPSPDSFHRLLRKTGFSPDETVMVGNLLETDIAGANAAGIMSILIERPATRSINEPYRDVIFPDLELGSLEGLLQPLGNTLRKEDSGDRC